MAEFDKAMGGVVEAREALVQSQHGLDQAQEDLGIARDRFGYAVDKFQTSKNDFERKKRAALGLVYQGFDDTSQASLEEAVYRIAQVHNIDGADAELVAANAGELSEFLAGGPQPFVGYSGLHTADVAITEPRKGLGLGISEIGTVVLPVNPSWPEYLGTSRVDYLGSYVDTDQGPGSHIRIGTLAKVAVNGASVAIIGETTEVAGVPVNPIFNIAGEEAIEALLSPRGFAHNLSFMNLVRLGLIKAEAFNGRPYDMPSLESVRVAFKNKESFGLLA